MIESSKTTDTKSEDRFLEFMIRDEFFGIPLLEIREVIGVPKTIPIPGAPSWYQGIMNLRGQVIPIIDLGLKLGSGHTEKTNETAVIIVECTSVTIGIIVDAVKKVITATEKTIQKNQSQNTKKDLKIDGVFRNGEQMTLILNIEKSLNLDDIVNATPGSTLI
ncbi:MAG: purine-binding chemotaxis protein CheW [Deltaproteobacteria bacterium]|nr:purine-binding chemotaxis protein CheW [Deltaproteobacteria bacterium]